MKSVKVLRIGDVVYPNCTVTEVGGDSLTITVDRKGETFQLTREPDEAWKLERRTYLWSDEPGFAGWKMPELHKYPRARRQAFKPGPMSPGTEVKIRQDGRMVSGEVWSDGPGTHSWWVVAEGRTVLVRESGGELVSHGDYWVTVIRRAEHVRRSGVFPVIQETTPEHHESWSRRVKPAVHRVMWHCSPDCPDAAGKERYHGQDESCGYERTWRVPWTAETIARAMVGLERSGMSPTPFCARCVCLDPSLAGIHTPGAVAV